MNYYFSPSRNEFVATAFQPDYEAAGTWPTDGVPVSDADFATYSGPAPAGQMRGADSTGNPVWVPVPAPTLSEAQTAQIISLQARFDAAAHADIAFTTAAGVADTYQADETARRRINRALGSYTPVGAVPAGFYWRSRANHNNAFTLADLQGLAKTIADREWADFQHLQNQVAQVVAATTVSSVQAVTW